MKNNLPGFPLKFLLYFLGFFLTVFVLLSFSIKFFSFPVSVDYFRDLYSPHSEDLVMSGGSGDAGDLFGKMLNPEEDSKGLLDRYANSISLESRIPGYFLDFTSGAKYRIATYALEKGFYNEGGVSYTPDPDFFRTSRDPSEISNFPTITAKKMSIIFDDSIDSSRILSGSEIEMGLDYYAQNSDVKIIISINPEILTSADLSLVEKTFSGLIFQGIHYATYSHNAQGRTPEEFSLVPPEFYYSLRSSDSLVDISAQGLTSILMRFGIINYVNAYCGGVSICACDDREPPCSGGCWPNSEGVCVGTAPCFWDPFWHACVNWGATCGMSGSNCHWVNPPPPPPEDPEDPPAGCVAQGGVCSADGDCCSGLSCDDGRCLGDTDCTCSSCEPTYSCGWGGGNENCDGNCWMHNKPWTPDEWCGDVWVHACRLSAGDYCNCCDCCSYSSSPSCGTLQVRRSGQSSASSCVSGLVDIVASGVSDAERAFVQVVSDTAEKTYWLTNAGGGTWQITGVDLGSEVGYGVVSLKLFPNNCAGRNDSCAPIAINVVVKPSCPPSDYVYVNTFCGSTVSEAWFFWGDDYIVPPAAHVLRINYWDGVTPEWMSANDRWIWVDNNSCGYTFFGTWECKYTIDNFKIGSYGNWPLWNSGNKDAGLGWKIQTVDACGDYSTQCYVNKEPFECQNTPPTCSVPVVPNEVLSGQSVTVSTNISDTVDPLHVTWSANCVGISASGTFNPQTGDYGNVANISTIWTAPDLGSSLTSTTCTITATVRDAPATAPVPGEIGTCSKQVTLINPKISGVLKYGSCDASAPLLFHTGSVFPASPPNLPIITIARTSPTSITDSITINLTNSSYSTYRFSYHTNNAPYSFVLPKNRIITPVDTLLYPVCVSSNRGTFSTGVTPDVTGTTNLASDLTVDIGYKLRSSLDTGWFSSIGGSVYSGTGILWQLTSANTSGYSSIFSPNPIHLTNKFVLSNGGINVSTSATPDVASTIGYVQNLPANGSWFSFKIPSSSVVSEFTSITPATFSNLNPNTIYKMSVSDMNTLLSSSSYASLRANYSSAIASNGVVVIYLTGNEDLVFEKDFITTNTNRKLLLVTSGNVRFSPSIGRVSPVGTTADTNIFVALIAGGNIVFPTGVPETDLEGQDTTIVVRGSLLSGGTIDFSRDRGLSNNHPSEVVFFEPSYYTQLQSQILANPSFEKMFFSLVSVSWGLEN
ncbi:hypothetical protein KBG31_01015 [Patescibacteria group bacterium]|nr:hypothetical protein [Patescibacteria group bacterium]